MPTPKSTLHTAGLVTTIAPVWGLNRVLWATSRDEVTLQGGGLVDT